eukprot:30725-Hanusia_phi.AAC.2
MPFLHARVRDDKRKEGGGTEERVGGGQHIHAAKYVSCLGLDHLQLLKQTSATASQGRPHLPQELILHLRRHALYRRSPLAVLSSSQARHKFHLLTCRALVTAFMSKKSGSGARSDESSDSMIEDMMPWEQS